MESFDFLIKRGFISKDDVRAILKHVGKVKKIFGVKRGLVHYVYKIEGQRKTAYLKIRSFKFSKIPKIKTDPKLIKYELKALNIYNFYFPEIFPEILIYNPQKNYLLLSDISHNTISLDKKLNKKELKEEDFRLLGKQFQDIHRRTFRILSPIREPNDEEFREKQMLYVFGFLNHYRLNKIIKLYRKIPRHLILGDPSPKNIYFNRNKIGICDLEHVHQGHYSFEVAHILAHLIVHNLENPKVEKLVNSFIKGYYGFSSLKNFEEELISYSTVGIILYRLASPIIPYFLPLDNLKRKKFTSIFIKALDKERLNLRDILYIVERRI